jgi:acyl-CoA thioesterase FadM
MSSEQIHHRIGRVQIYDTDASGLIFYGAPARWFADAEQELYDVLRIRMPLMDSENGTAPNGQAGPSAPTRSFEVHIDRPLRFRELYDHAVWISRAGRTSFSISHRISVDGEVRIRGIVHRVWVDVDPTGNMVPAVVPAMFRDAVVDAPL